MSSETIDCDVCGTPTSSNKLYLADTGDTVCQTCFNAGNSEMRNCSHCGRLVGYKRRFVNYITDGYDRRVERQLCVSCWHAVENARVPQYGYCETCGTRTYRDDTSWTLPKYCWSHQLSTSDDYTTCKACNHKVSVRYLWLNEPPDNVICHTCHQKSVAEDDRAKRKGKWGILLTKEHLILDFIQEAGSTGRTFSEIQKFIVEYNGMNWDSISVHRNNYKPGTDFVTWITYRHNNRGYYSTNLKYGNSGVLDRHCTSVGGKWVLNYLLTDDQRAQVRIERLLAIAQATAREEQYLREQEQYRRETEESNRRRSAEAAAIVATQVTPPQTKVEHDYSLGNFFGQRLIVTKEDE